MPGISVRPARSTTRSSGRVSASCPVPTDAMRSPPTTTVTPGLAGCSPSTRLAFVNTVRAMGHLRSWPRDRVTSRASRTGGEDLVPVVDDDLVELVPHFGERQRTGVGGGCDQLQGRDGDELRGNTPTAAGRAEDAR